MSARVLFSRVAPVLILVHSAYKKDIFILQKEIVLHVSLVMMSVDVVTDVYTDDSIKSNFK